MWKLFVVVKFSLEPIWFYLVEYFRATGFLFFSFSTLSLKLSIFLMLIPSQELQKDSFLLLVLAEVTNSSCLDSQNCLWQEIKREGQEAGGGWQSDCGIHERTDTWVE